MNCYEGSKSVANVGRSRGGLGPLGQKYVETVLRGAPEKESGIDDIYGVYLHKDRLMFGKINVSTWMMRAT